MKKSMIGVVVVLALIAIMLGGYIKNQIEASEEVAEQSKIKGYEVDLVNAEFGIKKGQMAPDFTLETITGETISLSQLKGKKVLLNFWATWCPPCKEEMPDLQNYYERYAKEENVEIVAVNLTYSQNSIKDVQLFADSYDLTFPIPLLHEEAFSKEKYQVLTIPSSFMIDTEGRIQKQIIGPLKEETIQQYLSELN
ncbi:thiol:disulfide interchange protein tlpA [Lysinibacillus sp. PLM2]|nr:thiol:disulfide interchange protein tlpA [Lysinibacillus sp. PLM2]